jgi:phosphatidylinositol dimannoside acyltransferase
VPTEGDSKQQAAAMTQQVARLFEAGIRAHPQDWHMLQKVFVADLDPARLAAAAAGRSEGHTKASVACADVPPALPGQSP